MSASIPAWGRSTSCRSSRSARRRWPRRSGSPSGWGSGSLGSWACPCTSTPRAPGSRSGPTSAYVRKGQFEGIRDTIATDPSRRPDFGATAVHPTAGAVAIGARPVLIAFNVNLATPDVAIAKKIAKVVRARDGGLPEVKALGFELKERNLAQVSMNLTDYRTTPIPKVVEAVRAEATRLGVATQESEVVGLIPEDALLDAAESYLQLASFDRRQILERRIAPGPPSSPTRLAEHSVVEFCAKLAARAPTPRGWERRGGDGGDGGGARGDGAPGTPRTGRCPTPPSRRRSESLRRPGPRC